MPALGAVACRRVAMTVRGMTVKGRTGRRTTLVAAAALVFSSLVGGGAVRAADQSARANNPFRG